MGSPSELEAPPGFEAPPGLQSPPDFDPPPISHGPPAGEPPVFEAPPPLDVPALATSPQLGGGRALIFRAAGYRLAVRVGQVVQVDQPGDVVPLPHTPAWLLGVTHLRGDIVSVVDFRAFLGQPAKAPGDRRLLVVRGAAASTGLLVDRIEGIRTLGDEVGAEGLPDLDRRLAAHASGPWEAAGEPAFLTDLGAFVDTTVLNDIQTQHPD